jgi:hypothetical protein
MYTHTDLARLQAQSLKMQGWIRQQTYSPENEKKLRRFSSWEVGELIFKVNQSTLRGRLAADPSLPQGGRGGRPPALVHARGDQRDAPPAEGQPPSLMPYRPAGKRAIRAAIANFKGGAGKSTVALHFAHAAALDGYRVLVRGLRPAGDAQPLDGPERRGRGIHRLGHHGPRPRARDRADERRRHRRRSGAALPRRRSCPPRSPTWASATCA